MLILNNLSLKLVVLRVIINSNVLKIKTLISAFNYQFATHWFGGLLCTFFLVGMCLNAQAQSSRRDAFNSWGTVKINAGLGVAYYNGDLQEINFARLRLGPTFNAGVSYNVTDRWFLRGDFNYYQLNGSHQGSRNSFLNLSFRARTFDVAAVTGYDIIQLEKLGLRTYLFAGLGMTYLNPKANLQGQWYSLPPLLTEGVKYNRWPIVIPFGIGFVQKINAHWGVGFELNYTYAFSDYIDDVSTAFVGSEKLGSPIAVALADRGPEIGEALRPAGAQRGNPNKNDGYYLTRIKVEYQLGPRRPNQFRRGQRCPK